MRLSLEMAAKSDAERTRVCRETCKARCCRLTHVSLREMEVETLRRHAVERSLNVALRRDQAGPYMRGEDQEGKTCPFLGADSACTVYVDRPNACRNFPDAPETDGCYLSGWQPSEKVVLASVHGKDLPYYFQAVRDNLLSDMMATGVYGGSVSASSVRVDQNRNDCVEAFLKTDAAALLFVDDDMNFPPGMAKRLLDAGKSIVCGLYFQRGADPYPHLYRYASYGAGRYGQMGHLYTEMRNEVYALVKSLPHVDKPVVNVEPGPYLEIDAGGTGCCLIRREVFEKMSPPWFRTEGATNGDMMFFRKAREMGCEVIADCGVIATHYRYQPVGVGSFLTAHARFAPQEDAPSVNSRAYWNNVHRTERDDAGLRHYDGISSILNHIISQFDDGPIKMADFGCGRTDLPYLIRNGRPLHITGIDFSEEAQRDNRRRLPDDTWLVADVQNAPLADGSMDMVFSNSVIEHLAEPKRLTDEMWRVLKPGGLMVLGIPLELPHTEHVHTYDYDAIVRMSSLYSNLVSIYPLDGRASVCLQKGNEYAQAAGNGTGGQRTVPASVGA